MRGMPMRGRLIATAVAALAGALVSAAQPGPAPAAAASGPVIVDPGFESGSWAGGQHIKAAFVSPGADGSRHAARIGLVGRAETGWIPLGGNLSAEGWAAHGSVSKMVRNVKPNIRYELTATVKGDGVEIGLYDNESTLYYSNAAGADRVSSSAWVTATATATSGPRTTELTAYCLKVNNAGASPGYCDDFVVTELGPAVDPQPAPDQWSTPPRTASGFPVTIPAVQSFVPSAGGEQWSLPRILNVVVPPDQPELLGEAETFADQLDASGLTRATAVVGQRRGRGDIVYRTGVVAAPEGARAGEAYSLAIAADGLTITGDGATGAFYGAQTMLQAFKSQTWLPAGIVTDWSDQQVRGVQIDAARKYFPISFLKNQIRDLAYTKMNTLQLSIKDGQGLRIDSAVAPRLVDRNPDSGHWSKAEVADLVAFAEQYHVTIVPVVNIPGHADSDLIAYPEYTSQATRGYDYAKPETREFLLRLATEVASAFHAKTVHLGGDEFHGYWWDDSLVEWARSIGGPDATGQDGYRALFNEISAGLAKVGVTETWVWNDSIGTPGEGVVPLDTSVVVHYWLTWSGTGQALANGYKIVGSPSDLYNILWPGYRMNNPTPDLLWRQFTTPYSFMRLPDGTGRRPPGFHGQVFPVWGDSMAWAPSYVVAEELAPRLRIHAQTMWNSPRPVGSLAEFDPYLRFLLHAPGYAQTVEGK